MSLLSIHLSSWLCFSRFLRIPQRYIWTLEPAHFSIFITFHSCFRIYSSAALSLWECQSLPYGRLAVHPTPTAFAYEVASVWSRFRPPSLWLMLASSSYSVSSQFRGGCLWEASLTAVCPVTLEFAPSQVLTCSVKMTCVCLPTRLLSAGTMPCLVFHSYK